MKGRKSWFLLAVIGLCWILIVSLAKDFGRVRSGFERINEANLKLSQVQSKNAELKKKMAYAQSEYYKEKIVREKLNMQRPEEIVVVLPPSGSTTSVTETASDEVREEIQNWQKWWEIVRN